MPVDIVTQAVCKAVAVLAIGQLVATAVILRLLLYLKVLPPVSAEDYRKKQEKS
ncbi:hypothetical protein Ferp_0500 [Ferroglobus placidus DSM 10642]|uniref:Uncharacterized protein n=1 Tax=Ferroglobus placidus (strain DSM 10642 / AEDII12DO) TaxID=589924 RepID=D3S341_FERPA|nr:hypothetical protein [Ferroglobus placidus]ADC64674.1 hypothetical protein Ferp_0500 [Ferroglobus placidus DSM 10642]